MGGLTQNFFPKGMHDLKFGDHWFMTLCVKDSDPNIHHQMSGEVSCGTSTQWNIIQPLKGAEF